MTQSEKTKMTILTMTTFDHLASLLESNSSVTTDEIQVLPAKSSVVTDENTKINTSDNSAVATADFTDDAEIRQLQLANLPNFPLREFLSISFTHHITILAKTKTYEEHMFYMKYADGYKPNNKGELGQMVEGQIIHHDATNVLHKYLRTHFLCTIRNETNLLNRQNVSSSWSHISTNELNGGYLQDSECTPVRYQGHSSTLRASALS